MESRKGNPNKASPLPLDYLKLVTEVFATNFEEGLKALGRLHASPARFEATGEILADEIVVAISLVFEDQLAATTVYASADFDPKASSPTLQELLAACVDGAGLVFADLMDPANEERLRSLMDPSMGGMENVPFAWGQIEANKTRIWVKLDKSNPKIELAADEWLAKHDPDYKARAEQEAAATEDLFFTGPKDKSKLH